MNRDFGLNFQGPGQILLNACQRNAQLNGDNKLGSLLLDRAKRMDNNWKVLSVDTERPGCTVSVTKGDTNDAQLELAVAGRCLRFLRNSGITTFCYIPSRVMTFLGPHQ